MCCCHTLRATCCNDSLRYDEAQARILCCDIKGGTECVRCCDGSRLVIEACTLSAFRVVRLLHASIGRLLWRGVG